MRIAGALLLVSVAAQAQNGLVVANASFNQMQLTWQASSGYVSPQYLVERCQGSGCTNFAQVATLTTASYLDAGLAHYTYYNYRVLATDGSGNFTPYGRVARAVTVDLVLQSTTGDRCVAVAVLSASPLATFTCNKNSPGGKPGLRTTSTLNNVNSVPNEVGYAWLALSSSILCLVGVNEDPASAQQFVYGQNAITTNGVPTPSPIWVTLPPSAIGYSCSVDGAVTPVGVWAAPQAPLGAARRSLVKRVLAAIGRALR